MRARSSSPFAEAILAQVALPMLMSGSKAHQARDNFLQDALFHTNSAWQISPFHPLHKDHKKSDPYGTPMILHMEVLTVGIGSAGRGKRDRDWTRAARTETRHE